MNRNIENYREQAKSYKEEVEVEPKATSYIMFQPILLFRVKEVTVSEGFEIEHVLVGNMICVAFVKKHPLCDVGQRITVIVRSTLDRKEKCSCWIDGREYML